MTKLREDSSRLMKLYLPKAKWGGASVYRQTSQFSGLAGGNIWCTFPGDDYDFIICGGVDEIPDSMKHYPRSKKVFVMHENPSIWKPSIEELSGFGVIISPWKNIKESLLDQHFIEAHSGVPWFYGIEFKTDQGLLHSPLKSAKELDYLENHKPWQKTKRISFIVSGKGWLTGHRWRLAIAKELAHQYPGEVDLFGFGHKPLADKAAALDNYQYSVVIENSGSDSYWTEKLSDCILGGSIPIYSGAKNAKRDLGVDFPTLEFGSDPGLAARQIIDIVEMQIGDYNKIQECRSRVLKLHNIMYWVPYLLDQI